MATEKRLIDANFLDDRCRRQIADEWNKKVAPVSWSEAYKEFLDDVWDAPTVDAVEVVHGRWIHTEIEDDDWGSVWHKWTCSNCVFSVGHNPNGTNYCPNCGAKMDGDGNG
jgi:rubrerythrin